MKNPGQTIQELREAGYQVKVRHNRVNQLTGLYQPKHEFETDYATSVSPKGGSTYVSIKGSVTTVEEEAFCCPTDTYNYKLGLTIALGRALKKLGK